MADVLTREHLEEALDAMMDAAPRPPVWIGPKWAVDLLLEHDGLSGDHVGACAECRRAWSVMARG